jgi:transcriptional regulator with XRE-family HTH domain
VSVARVDHPTDPSATEQDQIALGRALRKLRQHAGLTQEEMGNRLHTDPGVVGRIERGQRGIRWHTLQRFLRVLNADLHRLADAMGEVEEAGR